MNQQSIRQITCGTLVAALTLFGTAGAIAAPTNPLSPYFTDPQNSYVEDATSKGIGQVNMITCFITSMKPADLVNQPNYIALVDQKKCDSSSRSDPNNQGATNGADSPSYMRAIVNSTRTSNADPMQVKVWVDDTIGQANTAATIFVKASATQAPSTANPYGVFRLDFCGKAITDLPTAACAMLGYIDASATGLQYFQNESRGGSDTSMTQLALTQGSGGDTGAGQLSMTQVSSGSSTTSAFSFAYNATNYLRSDGTNNLCFSRTEANADKSVWRYALYNSDGTAVSVNSGFPVTWTDSGTTYQGQIGYYGLWMQDGKADIVPNGATLTKQSFGQGAAGQSYKLARAGGRLSKYVKQSTTLDGAAGVKLQAMFNTSVAFNSNLIVGFNNVEIYWDKMATQFMLSGTNSCGPNGCQVIPVMPASPLDNAGWANVMGGVFGYSQTLGGEIRIGDLTSLSGATNVDYRQQSLVYPSDMPASLYCLGECADLSTMTNFFTNQVGTPWVANTGIAQFAPQGVLLTDLVAYDANQTTGLISAAGMNAPMVMDSAWPSKPQYQWGFRNGKMFDTPSLVLCDGSADHYCGNKVDDLPTYYVWETGTSAFNQFFALTTTDNSNCGTSSDKYCRFDPPMQVTYTVPTGAEFGTYAGQKMVLQYGGYGNLWGVPGVCVNSLDNSVVDCSQSGSNQNIRFVPAFVIPFDATLGVVTAGNTTYYVRWLDREVRFAQVNASQCSSLSLSGATGLTLPTESNFLYPGVSTSANYIGPEPVVTDAPRVIGGVIMY